GPPVAVPALVLVVLFVTAEETPVIRPSESLGNPDPDVPVLSLLPDEDLLLPQGLSPVLLGGVRRDAPCQRLELGLLGLGDRAERLDGVPDVLRLPPCGPRRPQRDRGDDEGGHDARRFEFSRHGRTIS